MFRLLEAIFMLNIQECIYIYIYIYIYYNKSQKDALFLKFILVKNSTCFGQIYCSTSGVSTLYTQQYVFVTQLCLQIPIAVYTGWRLLMLGSKSVRNMQSSLPKQCVQLDFIIRKHHDARSSECQIYIYIYIYIYTHIHTFQYFNHSSEGEQRPAQCFGPCISLFQKTPGGRHPDACILICRSFISVTNCILLYSNIYPKRFKVTQFILSGNCSTCFGQ